MALADRKWARGASLAGESEGGQSLVQSTVPSAPYFSSSQSFAFLKCPLPKNPRLAESGEGCCLSRAHTRAGETHRQQQRKQNGVSKVVWVGE